MKPLIDAIEKKDVDTVRKLVEEGCDINIEKDNVRFKLYNKITFNEIYAFFCLKMSNFMFSINCKGSSLKTLDNEGIHAPVLWYLYTSF